MILAKGGSYWQGGRQYTLSLVEALSRFRRSPKDFEISVLVNGAAELGQFASLRPQLRVCADIAEVLEPYTLVNKIRWRFKRNILGWIAPHMEEALLRLGATFAYPITSSIIPSADWIPDFQYRHFPDGSNPAEIEGRKREFAAIVNSAGCVVLSSASAERDCHELFPHSIGKTSVLRFRVFLDPKLLAEDPSLTVRRYNLPERYVLVSNQLIPTKNHASILRALASMQATERADVHVVCTGDIYDYRNPGFYNGFLSSIHELGVRSNVSWLGLIPKRDQIQLLRAAVAYLQPSLFEGWNSGVEEAHLLGKPILLSDIPVHREQAPPRAIYFRPDDVSELARRLGDVFVSRAEAANDPERERQAVESYAKLQSRFAEDFLVIAAVPIHGGN